MPPLRKRLDLLTHPRPPHERARHHRAFYYSTASHGILLCIVLAIAYCLDHWHVIKSGSAPGAPTVTITTLTVLSAPPETPPPTPVQTPDKPTPPTPPTPVATVTPETPAESEPETTPAPPDATVPVLAIQQEKPTPTPPSKKSAPAHPSASHVTTPTTKNSAVLASATPSSYAPGPSDLPHPPYPPEARSHHQSGTVVMNVQFNSQGDVVEAIVAQSSGVPILDSSTRSFVRANWHNTAFAGQMVSVPVRYTFDKM